MITIIAFILILGLIITLHEFGHLVAAKIFGVYCREFSIGMGPKLTSFKGKETEYSLRLLPIGGYVAMAGEPDEEDKMPFDLARHRTLPGIHPFKRIVIYLAGIFMNIVLFVLAFTIVFNAIGIDDSSLTSSKISAVMENSAASKAGVMVDDTIIKVIIDGTEYEISNYSDLTAATSNNTGLITYVIDRDGEILEFDLVPQYDSASDRYLVGISFESGRRQLNLFESFIESIVFLKTYSVLIIQALGNLFIGRGLDQVGGPIAIYQATSEVVDLGLLAIVSWIGQLSLNVGIFNALPIPALDGGRVILTIAELILGRPVNKDFESKLIFISFMLLLGLMAIVIVNDIFGIF